MTSPPTQTVSEREVKPAVLRGLKERCRNCGKGKLFYQYLRVNDSCPYCGAELNHHRADNGRAYLTILIVGPIMGFVLHGTWGYVRDDHLILALFLCAAAMNRLANGSNGPGAMPRRAGAAVCHFGAAWRTEVLTLWGHSSGR
ncbi:DUF983 domain-containing protein [Marivivens donghaensis]|uniref:DUF983 domain-containing protein n=1 Tax=Marivivens donghaensis TaxID=1699413 RepID=A0ABX0VXD8_9RHOB|nr:DUF983 domain-containing protein [Marivivens donghaensis]NIY72758.1 DUF983 domain-containing protein [Marivivens donghaensis]